VCDGDPTWRISRRVDAVVSWACDEDLYTVCHRLQRDWEVSELVVVSQTKLREWSEVRSSLDAVAEETR
jgi:hypothetical protein